MPNNTVPAAATGLPNSTTTDANDAIDLIDVVDELNEVRSLIDVIFLAACASHFPRDKGSPIASVADIASYKLQKAIDHLNEIMAPLLEPTSA